MAERKSTDQEKEDHRSLKDCMLHIKTQVQLSIFLKDILLEFLDKVKPDDFCLIDLLLSKKYLNDVDYEELHGTDVTTSRRQARKVWVHLQRMSVDDFNDDIAPFLLKHYEHIIPLKYFSSEASSAQQGKDDPQKAECVRCEIMKRLHLDSMADIMHHFGRIDFIDYEKLITSTKSSEESWEALFDACRGLPQEMAENLTENICKQLMKYRDKVPQDIRERFATGLKCTCRNKLRKCKSQGSLLTTTEVQGVFSRRQQKRRNDVRLFKKTVSWAGDEDSFVLGAVSPYGGSQNLEGSQQLHLNLGSESSDNSLDSTESLLSSDSEIKTQERKQAKMFDCLHAGEHVRILLLGKAGGGKSATGNTIIGDELFATSNEFLSETSDCQLEILEERGCVVEIMDCPGLFDAERSEVDIESTIVKAVCGMSPGPDAILYVIKPCRYTQEEFDAFTRLKDMFDAQITDYMIILFTHGDQSVTKGKMTVVDMVEHRCPEKLKQVLTECGDRYIVFDNMTKTPKLQLERLVNMIREIKEAKKGVPYTCPHHDIIREKMEEEVFRRVREEEKAEESCSRGTGLSTGLLGQLHTPERPNCARQEATIGRDLAPHPGHKDDRKVHLHGGKEKPEKNTTNFNQLFQIFERDGPKAKSSSPDGETQRVKSTHVSRQKQAKPTESSGPSTDRDRRITANSDRSTQDPNWNQVKPATDVSSDHVKAEMTHNKSEKAHYTNRNRAMAVAEPEHKTGCDKNITKNNVTIADGTKENQMRQNSSIITVATHSNENGKSQHIKLNQIQPATKTNHDDLQAETVGKRTGMEHDTKSNQAKLNAKTDSKTISAKTSGKVTSMLLVKPDSETDSDVVPVETAGRRNEMDPKTTPHKIKPAADILQMGTTNKKDVQVPNTKLYQDKPAAEPSSETTGNNEKAQATHSLHANVDFEITTSDMEETSGDQGTNVKLGAEIKKAGKRRRHLNRDKASKKLKTDIVNNKSSGFFKRLRQTLADFKFRFFRSGKK